MILEYYPVSYMARYLEFLIFEVTHNIFGFSVIFFRKFETKKGPKKSSPKIVLTEFAGLLPFGLQAIPHSQKTHQPNR
jgi:hypothetical protein